MPETPWPTLLSTLWVHSDRMFWPSSSLACCPQPASDSSHSSYLPFLNRSPAYYSKFTRLPTWAITVIVLETTLFWSSFLSIHSTEVLQDRDQHPAGWPGVLHVSAEVPAASLFHAADPPISLPCWRSHWWGEGAEICVLRINQLFILIHILVSVFEPHSFCFVNCQGALNINERTIPQPRLLQLSVEKLSREGAFLMDAGTVWCCHYCYHL